MVYQTEIHEGKIQAETLELDVAWSQTYIWATKFYLKRHASDEFTSSTVYSLICCILTSLANVNPITISK
jgi:hypothetical protein